MTVCKFVLTLFGVILLTTPSLGAEVWDATYEASPANDDTVAAGPGKIRATRLEAGQRGKVEHFWGVRDDDTDDDNGLHRLGSARCFYSESAPTILSDTAKDYDSAGLGDDEVTLADSASNSDDLEEDDVGAGRCWIDIDGADGEINEDCSADVTPSACCTGLDTGTCNVDNNKLWVYVGIAGDAGSCADGKDCAWVEVKAEHDNNAEYAELTDAGVRVKGAPNILYNGDFDLGSVVAGTDYTGCATPTTNTTQPSGWTLASGAPTFDYVAGSSNVGQGAGCAVEVTDTAGSDAISQLLSNLKGDTTYRVIAQVKGAAADDICTVSTTSTGSGTQVTGMTTTGTSWATLDGFFITDTSLDDITLALTNTAAGDICTWDHIAVYRQESTEVPEAGMVAVYDTLTEQNIVEDICLGSGNPIDCCTGVDAGATCILPVSGATPTDVSELSVTFVPPTEGWIIDVEYSISVGCDALTTCALTVDEGVLCRLEKGGSAVAGTEAIITHTSGVSTYNGTLKSSYIDINPVAGTSITYTVGCVEHQGPTGLFYNRTNDAESHNTNSFLRMIAYPPH